jgi:hypothetical protein
MRSALYVDDYHPPLPRIADCPNKVRQPLARPPGCRADSSCNPARQLLEFPDKGRPSKLRVPRQPELKEALLAGNGAEKRFTVMPTKASARRQTSNVRWLDDRGTQERSKTLGM